MVEVLKTNVQTFEESKILLESIHDRFKNYSCNFDLEDCDRILRIETENSSIDAELIIELLGDHGYVSEILEEFP